MKRLSIVFLFLISQIASAEQDWIETHGHLEDDAFYRLTACGAPVDGDCDMPFVRWSEVDATDLTVSIQVIDPGYPRRQREMIDKALNLAISEINRADSKITFRRLKDSSDAHVTIWLRDFSEGDVITDTGSPVLDGERIMGVGHVQIWWNASHELTRGVIIITNDIVPTDIKSVLLEELTQSLGFLYDIRNPWYETRSIISEDSNQLTRLGTQDVMILRRHYPKD